MIVVEGELTYKNAYLIEVARGNIVGATIVHKFGRNGDIANGTSEDIISQGGTYAWLQSATTLEAISSSVNDDSGGTGARVITVQGLDENFDAVEEDITMNGTSVSIATTATFIRVNRAFVKDAGTYASTSAGGNAGTITVRIVSAGATQIEIALIGAIAVGQSQIARYTVPNGKTAYILSTFLNVNSIKTADVYCWQRQGADIVSAPFTSKRLVFQFDSIAGGAPFNPDAPSDPFPEKTDIWFTGFANSANTEVEVDFELLVIDN